MAGVKYAPLSSAPLVVLVIVVGPQSPQKLSTTSHSAKSVMLSCKFINSVREVTVKNGLLTDTRDICFCVSVGPDKVLRAVRV